MNKFNQNLLFAIPLFFIIFSCSVGNNSTAGNNTDKYNFASLTRHSAFYTPPPDDICPDMQINRESGLQPPEADCNPDNSGVHSQIAYGCNVESNDPENVGNRLSKSVVAIARHISESDNDWYISCTGVIIESTWILTAAHCLGSYGNNKTRGTFDDNIQNLMIIPWQPAYNGVPTGAISESTNVIKFPAKAIYIPYHFGYYDESYLPPYSGFIKDDFALIELESALPNNYKPISIESALPGVPTNTPLWSTGYGINESQTIDGQLHYRQIYYYSNLFNISPDAWTVGNQSESGPSLESGIDYGMIYALGSIPESTESQPPAAWSFLGPGDSGGPLLSYNQHTQMFSIWAIFSGGECRYAGFYAPLPYPFMHYTAITNSRYTMIQQIMNKTVSRTEVRCISKDNACYPRNVYVLNKGSNSVNVYSFESNNNLHLMQTITTGINPQAFTFDTSYSYLLVANNGNTQADQGSISVFKINFDGSLSSNLPGQFNIEINKPVDIVINNYGGYNALERRIYVANNGNNSITGLSMNHDNGVLSIDSVKSLPSSNLNRIKFMDNILYAFDSADNKIFILGYDLDVWKIESNNLSFPTDLTYHSPYHTISFVVNSGNHSILKTEYNLNLGPRDSFITDSHGAKPSQIIKHQNFYYVNNLESNNIAIFKNNLYESLVFTNTIPTGKEPINIMITESQLWVANFSDNSVWYYNILPDGHLEFKESAATGLEPVAVLVN